MTGKTVHCHLCYPQFIISTHPPILMKIPDAAIYQIQDDSIQQVAYKETDHYRVTKVFRQSKLLPAAPAVIITILYFALIVSPSQIIIHNP